MDSIHLSHRIFSCVQTLFARLLVATESSQATHRLQDLITPTYFDRNKQQDSHSAIVATLVAFACHPTCIGPGLEQSADYCGVVRNAVADAVGETATVFYLNGACGDVNPVLHRGGFSAAVATRPLWKNKKFQVTRQWTAFIYRIAFSVVCKHCLPGCWLPPSRRRQHTGSRT